MGSGVGKLGDYVTSDPKRLGGEPVFRGTRVPVRSLFDHLKAGDCIAKFLEDFPGVTQEQFKRVLEIAEAGVMLGVRVA